MDNDEIEIKISVSLGLVGCEKEVTIEVGREEWEEMTSEQRDEMCREVMFELIEWSYEEVED